MEPPPVVPRAPRITTLTKIELEQWNKTDQTLQDAPEEWREKVAALEWGPNHFIGGFGILPDEHIDRLVWLARRGVLANTDDLQRDLKWCNHARYGTNVLAVIHSIYPCRDPSWERDKCKGVALRGNDGTGGASD